MPQAGKYIHTQQWDVTTYPYPNFNGGLLKQPLKVGMAE